MNNQNMIIIGYRSIVKRGGSFQVILPQEVAKKLELEEGDIVAFVYDANADQILLAKPVKSTLIGIGKEPTSLPFSVSSELAKKLLKEVPPVSSKAKTSSLKAKIKVNREFREL